VKGTRAIRGALRTARTLLVWRGAARRRYATAWWMLLVCRLRLRFPRWLGGRRLLAGALLGESDQDGCAQPPAGLECFRQALADQPLHSSCLPRAVALKRFLERQGCRARIELGMTRDHAGLRGHAWVVCGDEGVLEDPRDYLAFRRAR